ncbi:peptide-methionine (S)-S-oxide reductase [Marinoscillum sp.]|uniref:peptide-methionine (S)-S-oxide reductase n=1 Tax=Marinoscillum sp. TaxID=2024838 RepID=UPI003BAA9E4E
MTLGLGGGCHWCTEAVFARLKGVSAVSQGWISSVAPNEAFSEAIEVQFDPEIIPLEVIIHIHLRTHSSASEHAMRHKYRSAIYTVRESDALAAEASLAALQPHFPQPLITQVLPLVAFRLNSEEYLDYYLKNPEKPFCKTYIDPKIRQITHDFSPYCS